MTDIHKKQLRALCNIGFILYVIMIFYFVLLSERYGRQIGYETCHYNLVPFKEIKRFIVYRHLLSPESFITNLIGNVFAFSPFGALLPVVVFRKTGFRNVIAATFCFSLSIELMQLVFRIGVFDVDDLMMNTLGGLIGFLFYKIVRRFYDDASKKSV